jgi:hypothetical protein
LIYVPYPTGSSTSSDAIEAFPLYTGGNIHPTKTISGSQTQLMVPSALAFDSSGNLYVTNGPTWNDPSLGSYVTIYARGSTGNAAPVRVIQGSGTGFDSLALTGLAVDSDGYLYVSEDTATESCPSSSSCTATSNDTIAVFAPNANGNVAPVRTISSASCFAAGGMALLPSNDLVVACMPPTSDIAPYSIHRRQAYAAYRARRMDQSQSAPAQIVTFAAGASGNAAPINVIGGSSTDLSWAGPLALSPSGVIFVVPRSPYEQDPSILGFPQGASGDIAPMVNITGPSTQLNAMSLIVDPSGTIYALNSNNGAGSLAITAYRSSSNGDVAPTYVISGSNTGLSCPEAAAFCGGGIAVGPP